jgi:hypothetical protein
MNEPQTAGRDRGPADGDRGDGDRGPMTHGDILTAARIIDGCRRDARVTWAADGDVSRLLTGTMRHVTNGAGDGAHADTSRDIRGQFVRISATFEHWLPVADIMAMLAEGLFAFDFEPAAPR